MGIPPSSEGPRRAVACSVHAFGAKGGQGCPTLAGKLCSIETAGGSTLWVPIQQFRAGWSPISWAVEQTPRGKGETGGPHRGECPFSVVTGYGGYSTCTGPIRPRNGCPTNTTRCTWCSDPCSETDHNEDRCYRDADMECFPSSVVRASLPFA